MALPPPLFLYYRPWAVASILYFPLPNEAKNWLAQSIRNLSIELGVQEFKFPIN
jgi:hypothetical protein